MELLVIPKVVGGDFHFVDELDGDPLELVQGRHLLAARDTCPEEYTLSKIEIGTVQFGCWWYQQEGCEGSLSCECGPVTLLEVLGSIDPGERQRVVELHMAHLGVLYDHFWSCDRLLRDPSDSVSTTCSSCISDTSSHSVELHDAAMDMAVELGEALACYSAIVLVGASRYMVQGETSC